MVGEQNYIQSLIEEISSITGQQSWSGLFTDILKGYKKSHSAPLPQGILRSAQV